MEYAEFLGGILKRVKWNILMIIQIVVKVENYSVNVSSMVGELKWLWEENKHMIYVNGKFWL